MTPNETNSNADLHDQVESLTAQFQRIVGKTKNVLFIERIVPRVLPPLYTGSLFLSASWAGLWLPLPAGGRMAGVLAFAVALVASPLFAKTKSIFVTKDDALRHLDDKTGDPSRPARTLADKVSAGSSEKASDLWALHVVRTWEKWGDKLEAGKPDIDLQKQDPYKLRYLAALSLITTAFIAGGDYQNRIEAAFDWTTPPPPPTGESSTATINKLPVKAWVVPPEGIEGAPLYLNDPSNDQAAKDRALQVHMNSVMTILITGTPAKVSINGENVPVQKTIAPKSADQGQTVYQYEVKLTAEKTTIAIENGPQWDLTVTPDQAPSVTVQKIEPNDKNVKTLDLGCTAKDDYGIKEGEVIIRLPGAPATGATPLPSGSISPIPLPAPCIPQ